MMIFSKNKLRIFHRLVGTPTRVAEREEKKQVQTITLFFDTDYDHPLESSLWGHKEDVIPFCVREYKILDDTDKVIYQASDNH